MRFPSDKHEKMMSAYQLLQTDSISLATFEHIRTLIKGFHPELDKKLEMCSQALDKLQKIESGDVISLSVEVLPEDTEEKKKRKKALLFFISSVRNLKSEIKRIDTEFTKANERGNTLKDHLSAWGRIIGFAKGPFGIATLIALLVTGFILLRSHKTQHSLPGSPQAVLSPMQGVNNFKKIQIINYNGKQIPLDQLYIGHGTDCDSPHYHAITGSVTTLDGTLVPDPENCGYGKLKDVHVLEVTISISPKP